MDKEAAQDFYDDFNLNNLYELAYAGKDRLLCDEDYYFEQVINILDNFDEEEIPDILRALARGNCSYTLANISLLFINRFLQMCEICDSALGFDETFGDNKFSDLSDYIDECDE